MFTQWLLAALLISWSLAGVKVCRA